MDNFSHHQQKIIKRYYREHDQIKQQRLAELITEVYLAEGKKRDRIWKQIGELLASVEFPQARIDHLLARKDPTLLPAVLQELESAARPKA
jgi:hypothetical protein